MCLTPAVQTSDLFELLRDGRPWTRAQLAEATGLARSTIAARIDVLMRLGLVAPYGGARSTGGRPPAAVRAQPDAPRVVVGVDVGATHARAALADLAGTILAEAGEPTSTSPTGPEVVLGWVDATVARRCSRASSARPATWPPSASGLPGPGRALDRPADQPADHARLGPLRRAGPRAAATSTCRCSIDNDVNIMALGEQHAAPARRRRPGLHQGRHRHRRRHHLRRRAPARRPGHRRRPRARPGAPRRRRRLPLRQHRLPRGGGRRSGAGRTRCARPACDGPRPARTSWTWCAAATSPRDRRWCARPAATSARCVATMVNLINPSVVVIGGRLAGAGEHLLAGIREIVYQRSLPLATEHLRIVPSRGRRAGRRARGRGAGDRARALARRRSSSACVG